QGGLFSSSAVRQAEQQINHIYNRFNKDVFVETFTGIPASRQAEYERNRETFFNTLLQERATEHRVNGVYVMVVKEGPPQGLRVQVGAGRNRRAQLFPRGDQDQIVRTTKADLHSGNFDRALRDSVSGIEVAFQRNATASHGFASAPSHRVSRSGSLLPL